MATETLTEEYTSAWNDWHAKREAGYAAPLGTASLASTEWITETPRTLAGIPGNWKTVGETVVAEDVPSDVTFTNVDGSPSTLSLSNLLSGDEFLYQGSIFRVIDRDGPLAIRQNDPKVHASRKIEGIATWAPSASWILPATFVPNNEGAEVKVTSIDGVVAQDEPSGWLTFEKDGVKVDKVPVYGSKEWPMLVFHDESNGPETYKFRFLFLNSLVDGGETIDFNRAVLPPCSVSGAYFCPVPPEENKFPFAIEAGERAVIRG